MSTANAASVDGGTRSEPTPRLRGRLHQAAFLVAIPAGVALVAVARTSSARIAAIVYAVSLAGLYGVSGAYHRHPWSPRALQWMKRIDHSMIFVLIAGTYTPVALFALQKPWSLILLAAVWAGAVVGVALKLLNVEGFRGLTGTLYIALGWLVVLQAPQLVRGIGPVALPLIVLGGLIYTAGTIVLLRNKPDPIPAVFGYKEMWHAMVIAGSACHYAAILVILLSVRAAVG